MVPLTDATGLHVSEELVTPREENCGDLLDCNGDSNAYHGDSHVSLAESGCQSIEGFGLLDAHEPVPGALLSEVGTYGDA